MTHKGEVPLSTWYRLIVVMATVTVGDLQRGKSTTSGGVGPKPNIILILVDDVGKFSIQSNLATYAALLL